MVTVCELYDIMVRYVSSVKLKLLYRNTNTVCELYNVEMQQSQQPFEKLFRYVNFMEVRLLWVNFKMTLVVVICRCVFCCLWKHINKIVVKV